MEVWEHIFLKDFNRCMLDSSMKPFCETFKFGSLLQKPRESIYKQNYLAFIKWYWLWWKYISLKANHVSLYIENIKTFVMKHPWLLYSMNWQTRAFLYENGLDAFSKICKNVLEKHAPRKKRYLRANQLPLNLKSNYYKYKT